MGLRVLNAKTAVSVRSVAAWTIVFLPALTLLFLLLHFSVDVPFWDDWDIPGSTYDNILRGQGSIYQHFFGQNIETRDAFPRLIFVAVGFTLGWHVTIFIVMSWLFALVTFLALLKLMPVGLGRRSLVFPWIMLLIGGLVFSSSQWQNWLWSTQMAQFIPPCCLALCLLVQTSPQKSMGFKIIACAMLNVLATFSPSNGMLLWGLAFPFMLIPFTGWKTVAKEQRTRILKWISVYLGLAILTIVFYFWDYKKPADSPPLDIVFDEPGLVIECFLAWIGAPYVPYVPAGNVQLALLTGGAMLLLFSFALVLVWVQWKRACSATVKASWPWICLGGFGIATGVVTALARAGRGVGPNIAPRYFTHSLWIAIALVGLLYTLWSYRQRTSRVRDVAFGVFTGVIFLLTLYSWPDGVRKMRTFNTKSRQNLLTVRLADVAPTNPLWSRVNGHSDCCRTARFLMDRGVLQIERIGNWITEKIRRPDAGVGGRFKIVGESDRDLRVEGWAVLPGHEAPPDFVILAKTGGHGRFAIGEDATNKIEIVAGFIAEKNQPDTVTIRDKSDSPLSWFDATLNYPFAEEHDLLMFAVDVRGRRVYRMDHDIEASRSASYTLPFHLDTAEITVRDRGKVGRTERIFTIGDDKRWTMVQHPNAEIAFKDIFVGEGATLEFGAGVNGNVWDKPGDGVMFEINLLGQDSTETTIFSQWIDPKNNPGDRRWFDTNIELAGFAGQEITIRLKTTSGPASNARFDSAGWSRPQIVYRERGKRRTGLVGLWFVSDAVRIEHPLADTRLELASRWGVSTEVPIGLPVGTRFSSSNPKIIEVLDDGQLLAHRYGAVQIVARNGRLEARVGVEAAWAPVIPYGVGRPGKGGIVPVLDTGNQRPTLGNLDFRMRVSGVVGGAEGMLVVASDPVSKSISPVSGIVPTDAKVHLPLTAKGPKGAAGKGVATFTLQIPNVPEFLGRVEFWQGFFKDEDAETTWSATNGLIVTVK